MKNFHRIAGIVFLGAAVLHLGRVALGLSLVIGGYALPSWLSLVVGLGALALAWFSFKLS